MKSLKIVRDLNGLRKTVSRKVAAGYFPPAQYETACLITLSSALNRIIKNIIYDIYHFLYSPETKGQ